MLLEEVYAQLKRQHLCSSAYEFSVTYLGKSPSYYSVLKTRGAEPSTEVIVNLETALRKTAGMFSDRHPILTKTRQDVLSLHHRITERRTRDAEERLTRRLWQT